jgi:ATP-dependent DNA helicase RecQ
MLRSAAMGRMDKMMDYVSQTDVCRSAYLLEYFGQNESADCGTCDVCRAARQAKKVDLTNEIHNYVNMQKGGIYTLEEFVSHFSSAYSSDACISELRRLIDEGSIPPPQYIFSEGI